LNLLAVLNYAVDVLHVEHIIVCGHYGCGGVIAAMENKDYGSIINKWLRNIKEVYALYAEELNAIEDFQLRSNRLVELNVMEQVKNLAKTSVVQKAWEKRALAIHGWVYGFNNGIITDLNCMMNELNDLEPIFRFKISDNSF